MATVLFVKFDFITLPPFAPLPVTPRSTYACAGTIVTQPVDVTVSIGEDAVFTCAINRHGNKFSGDDVKWQRVIEGGVINIPETRGHKEQNHRRCINNV